MSTTLSRLAAGEPAREPRAGSADDARRLAVLVKECATSGISRRALLLRLSLLPDGRNRPHHLQLAAEALLPLTGAARAQLFRLPNQDHVVVWRGDTPALAASLDTLRHLFADDPGFGPDPMALASVLSLPEDAAVLGDIMADDRRSPLPPPIAAHSSACPPPAAAAATAAAAAAVATNRERATARTHLYTRVAPNRKTSLSSVTTPSTRPSASSQAHWASASCGAMM